MSSWLAEDDVAVAAGGVVWPKRLSDWSKSVDISNSAEAGVFDDQEPGQETLTIWIKYTTY